MEIISALKKIRLYYYTVRYLTPKQIFYRLRLHYFPPKFKPAPAMPVRSAASNLERFIYRPRSVFAHGKRKLFNLEITISETGLWDNPEFGKALNLEIHCHEDLLAYDATERLEQQRNMLYDWIDRHPPLVKHAWLSYNISKRVQRWIFWSLRGGDLGQKGRKSLADQAVHLVKIPEFNVPGNHVWENWVAVVMAGLFFDGPHADKLYRKGSRELDKVIRQQINPDGGHFELSTTYQTNLIELLLDLYNLHQVYHRPYPKLWRTTLHKMYDWLRVMIHPDGEVAMFNDGNFETSTSPLELAAYASRLGLDLPDLKGNPRNELLASGYARLEADDTVVFFDAAPIGPDILPGHGHADALSLEVSRAGRRMIVNTGTSEYDMNKERDRQRGTSAHSTLVYAHRDSSEMWASFRVARRARIVSREFRNEGDAFIVRAAHDGYRQQLKAGLHQRTVRLEPGRLTVIDEINGAREDAVELYFYLAPGIVPSKGTTSMDVLLHDESGHLLTTMTIPEGLHLNLEPTINAVGHRQVRESMRIRLSGRAHRLNRWTTILRW